MRAASQPATRKRSWPGRSGRTGRCAPSVRPGSSTVTVAVVSSAADQHAADPAVVVADVGQADRHDLADLALEVGRRAQRPLDPGAGDLQRVVPGDRVVVVELPGHQPAGQGQGVEGDPALRSGRGVEGDTQRAAALLDVVDVEAQIGGDGRDELADAGQHRALGTGLGDHIDLLSRNEAWARSPRLSVARTAPTERTSIISWWRAAGRPVGPGGSVRRMLRMSTLFLRTLREDPADAEVPSHRLLVRAGYIRRAAPGGFTWLPLGWIVYRNVENIVREEMDRAGFQEVHFPALLPREPYEATGRWDDYGDNMFRLQRPAGQRLPARTDARGDVHAPRQGPVLVVQGPARCASTRSRRSTATRPGRAPACCAAGSS